MSDQDHGVEYGIMNDELCSFTYGGPGELAPLGVYHEGYADD
jgi:hypothetical protein